MLEWLRFSVSGIDVHPVAVSSGPRRLGACRPARDRGCGRIRLRGQRGPFPIYLGDSLQLRFPRWGTCFAQHNITIQVEDEQNTELVFPGKPGGARRDLRCFDG